MSCPELARKGHCSASNWESASLVAAQCAWPQAKRGLNGRQVKNPGRLTIAVR